MLGLGRPEGAQKIGRFVLHYERKSQPPTISLSSFFLLQQTESPPPATTGAGGLSSGSGARPHGRMRHPPPRPDAPPPPMASSSPSSLCVAARGSRGSLGAEQQGDGLRKQASSHGDEETFMACDRICACCKSVFYVFQMFHKDLANASCGCCKSRSGCFSVAT
jgi:hypothetical protein